MAAGGRGWQRVAERQKQTRGSLVIVSNHSEETCKEQSMMKRTTKGKRPPNQGSTLLGRCRWILRFYYYIPPPPPPRFQFFRHFHSSSTSASISSINPIHLSLFWGFRCIWQRWRGRWSPGAALAAAAAAVVVVVVVVVVVCRCG